MIYVGGLIALVGPTGALWLYFLQCEAEERHKATTAKEDGQHSVEQKDRVVRRISELRPVLELLAEAPRAEKLIQLIEQIALETKT